MELKFELSKYEISQVTDFVVNARELSENLVIKNTKKKMAKFAYLTNSRRHYEFKDNLIIDKIANQSFEYSYIRKIEILPKFIIFLTDTFQISIPKRCFSTDIEYNDFIQYIDDKRNEKQVDKEDSKRATIRYETDRDAFLKMSSWIHKFDFKLQENIFKIILGLIILFGLNFLASGIILGLSDVNQDYIKANFIVYIVLLVLILFIGFKRPAPKYKKQLLNAIDNSAKFYTEISINEKNLIVKDSASSKSYPVTKIADTFQHLSASGYIIKTGATTFEYIYITKLYYAIFPLLKFDKLIKSHIKNNNLQKEAQEDLKIKNAKVKKLKMLCGLFLFLGIILMLVAFIISTFLLTK